MKNHALQHQGSPRASLPLQRQYKGGSAPKPPAPIPPVSQSSTEVGDAERQQRLAQANRKGMKSTLLAGGNANAATTGPKSLLG